MSQKKQKATYFSKLEQKAEDVLKTLSSDNDDPVKFSSDDMKALIHDLQVHQIELETQNDELRRSQNELIKSKTDYTELYDYAPVGYLTLSPKGLVLKSNLTLTGMLSIERSYLIGKPLSGHIIFDDQDIYYQYLQKLSNLKTKQVCELRMKKRGGIPFDALLESSVILDDCGDLEHYRIMVIDISERKQFVKELTKSEARFKKIIKKSPLPMIITDQNQDILFFNDKFTESFGYTLEDVSTAEKWWKLAYPDEEYRSKVQESWVMAIEKATIDHTDIEMQEWDLTIKDRTKRSCEFFMVPMSDISLIIMKDITNQKRIDKQIKESLKEKEVLLQELYHRTKNNMQVIMAMISLQTHNIEDENILQIFKETKNRINTMALVHEKLYQTMNLSRIDLKDYFSDLINLLKSSYQDMSEGIRIKTDMSPAMVTIDSAIPCGLIINELISNVFKHAFPENRNGEIQINLKMTDDEEIEFIVSDNGIGLPDGFDVRNCDSMGLQATVTLAEHQLLGSLKVVKDNGTQFHITFKESSHKVRA